MNFDLHFSRPVNTRNMDEFLAEMYFKFDHLDPFRRISLIQDILLGRNIGMKATLRITGREEEKNGGMQGLWGRN